MSHKQVKLWLLASLAIGAGVCAAASWWARVEQYPRPRPARGLRAFYYPNRFRRKPALRAYDEVRTTLSGAELSPARGQDYSLTLQGILFVTVPGPYRLGTASDDDSWLVLDGLVLVDNHGEHPLRRRLAWVWLAPGPHLIQVDYTQRKGKAALQLWWQPPWRLEAGLMPAAVLSPVEQPFSLDQAREWGYRARGQAAGAWAVVLAGWLFLAVGLWPRGGWRWVLGLGVGAAPLVVLAVVPQVQLDLWCDELTSLTMFSLAPLARTVTYYPFANNHIFYNLLNNLFLRLVGCHELGLVMDNPFPLRLLALAYALGALAWLYRAMVRHFNQRAALLGFLALATTLPFANFATQLRGYSLSLLLVVVLLDWLLCHLERPRLASGVGLALVHAAFLYTLPSNLFFSAPLMAILAAAVLLRPARRSHLTALGWLAAGLVLAGLAYLPVWSQLFKLGASSGLFSQGRVLTRLLPTVGEHLFSSRWLLLPLLALGLAAALRGEPDRRGLLLAGGLSLLGPFLLTWAYGVVPYQRVLLVLAPVMAGLMGLLLEAPLARWGGSLGRTGAYLALVAALSLGSLVYALREARSHLEQDLALGRVSQDLSYCFYLYRYSPREAMLALHRRGRCLRPLPVVYEWHAFDGYAVWEYAKHFHFEVTIDPGRAREALRRNGCLYLVSHHRLSANPLAGLEQEDLVLTPLDAGSDFYRLYRLGRRQPAGAAAPAP